MPAIQKETMRGPEIEQELGVQWFLLRTKPRRERVAVSQLSNLQIQSLLPLAELGINRWGKIVSSVGPLFPGYLFARFHFERHFADVRYARGVREIVCFGGQPAVVPEWMIAELTQRMAQGPVSLSRRPFVSLERVMVVAGPLKEFEGIFQRYLPGRERVAILLSTMSVSPRVLLPASMVAPLS